MFRCWKSNSGRNEFHGSPLALRLQQPPLHSPLAEQPNPGISDRATAPVLANQPDVPMARYGRTVPLTQSYRVAGDLQHITLRDLHPQAVLCVQHHQPPPPRLENLIHPPMHDKGMGH